MVPLCVWAASLPAGLRPALSTTTGLALAAERSALMKRRALEMPSMYTTMLCVRASWARKSSTWAMSTSVLGPSDTTAENPTALLLAQSRIDEVSAPDWHTSARGPSLARGPAALALSCRCGRWNPSELGPSRYRPSRRAIFLRLAAWSASMPLDSTSAARQPMRPATSSAAGTSAGGSAMMARSDFLCARSASVPLVWVSTNCRLPAKRCARRAGCSACAYEVSDSGLSALPARTAMEAGANSGVR